MAETTTNRGRFLIVSGGLSLLDLRALAFTGTDTGTDEPDLNTVADLDAVTGVSIHTERLTLSSETVTEDDVNNRANADCANLAFAAAPGVIARGVAIYHEGNGTDAGRSVLAIFTTGFPQVMDGGLNVTINDWLRGI